MAMFRWSLSSTTSAAGSHADAIEPPFQPPSASSMTLLRRLRPEKRSCVGSTARRLVVTNMFSILLLFERCARPSPSGLAGRARCRPRARLGGEDWVILADRPISLSGPSVGLAGGDGRTGGRADRRTGGG